MKIFKKLKLKNNDKKINKETIYLYLPILFIFMLCLLYFIYRKKIIIILIIMSALVYALLYFYKKNSKKNIKNNNSINDFINYISFLRIYLLNKESVYTSFIKTVPLAPDSIKGYLEELIESIDNDKTVKPYIVFAKKFNNQVVEDIMISIYQMVENGHDINYINQLTHTFENFKLTYYLENENKRIEKFDLLISTSLIGSGFIMMILVIGIISLIGEMI
ncbi:MAG: hypothetical protein ACTTID_02465 [Bacillales bacterium]